MWSSATRRPSGGEDERERPPKVADINEKNARDAARRIGDAGGAASAFAVDIGDDAQVAALAAHVDARHGRCEVLVNNAAIADNTGIEKIR